MQHQHAGYGAATPGMTPAYPSPSPPSYASPPSNPPYYHPSSYANYAPSSPILSSSSADYLASYPGSTAQESGAGMYAQIPAYAPPPPDPATFSYSTHDPSYSPRAPSFDRLPSHERSSFEPAASSYTHSWPSAYGTSDYQLGRSSSYGGGYGTVDAAVYSEAASRWGYEPAVSEENPHASDGRYGGVAEKSSSYSTESGGRVDYSTGVYAYDGGSSQPYGSRGTGSARWASESSNPLGDLPKLAKALPKVDSESRGGGVQKYHVKLLQDSSSVGLPTNVVCQIGLDGVRLVDPSSGRTLRIYPLDTITKWEVNEPSVFTFWAKSAVDFEQRRTRLQSSASTTNAILDTLTAACVQLCEMVGKSDAAKASISSIVTPEKKFTFSEWLTRSKAPVQEEKDHWVPDEAVTKCTACSSDFGPFLRRHHCRNCGDIFCDKCTRGRTALTSDEDAQIVRVCDRCLAEVTQRLTNTKETSNKFASQQSHEDLAKKLQEELERNAPPRKTVDKLSGQTSLLNCSKCGSVSIVTGSTAGCPTCGSDASGGRNGVTRRTSRSTDGSRRRTRDVACPTCTVHLEVEVPSFGSETVECGVCQHPFLVSA
ncbi:protein FREE1 [Selaginella moellendorffii]|uniref:protein FREE1 n=1 Tax=Selaginella moellendorffii TaxID=88036 RepID=UPI000D1CA88B|nr:protein FREE1 [Selaginella moellendorffii]|eukprot:XP_024520954.1 protein FREE1 [Selaginella moellendorffii]